MTIWDPTGAEIWRLSPVKRRSRRDAPGCLAQHEPSWPTKLVYHTAFSASRRNRRPPGRSARLDDALRRHSLTRSSAGGRPSGRANRHAKRETRAHSLYR